MLQVEQEEWDHVRNLYERLLERTHHVKVWISFAKCEHSMSTEDNIANARAVFQRANRALRMCQEKEQRLMLLEAWRDFEDEFGDAENEEKVKKLMPRKVTRRRQVTTDDGSQTRWEEYIDYIFPDDEAAKPSLLLLAKAKEWAKKQKEHTQTLEEITSEVENPCYEETSEINPDLDRDDSDVEIGSSSSESSSESDQEVEITKNGKENKKRRKPSCENSDDDKTASKKRELNKKTYSSSSDEEIDRTKMREVNRKYQTLREEKRPRIKKESGSSSSSSDSSSESTENEK